MRPVNIRERVFLIAGCDFSQRQIAVEGIKKRIFKGTQTALNTFVFYPKEIDFLDLQEKLLLNSFGGSRLIIFKDFLDLNPQVADFLSQNLKKISAGTYFIFETDKDYYWLGRDKKIISHKFFSWLLKEAALIKTVALKREASFRDFLDSLNRKDLASSLYILESLFQKDPKDKLLGPQVIGALVKRYANLSQEKGKTWDYLWEADRAIKEKGLDPRLILEALLVKLCGLG